MTKPKERLYFKAIGKDGVDFTLHKPFSDPNNVGSLLSDIAAVFTLLPEPPAKLLDLGCGSGWTSNFYAQAGYDVTGVDISRDAIDAANSYFTRPGLKLSFVCADYDKIKAEGFDCAVFFDSLHHADSELAALTAAYKALKPGGKVILCEPGVGHSRSSSSIEAARLFGVNERDMPPKLSRQALKSAGFTSISTFAYPAITHRMLYSQRSGQQRIRNAALVRGASAALASTLLRSRHGIVIATKL